MDKQEFKTTLANWTWQDCLTRTTHLEGEGKKKKPLQFFVIVEGIKTGCL